MSFSSLDPNTLDWTKTDGLIPAVIQHATTGAVLMLGYMNQESLKQTLATGKATFYSRTKQRLWVKGETSGHYLNVVSLTADCDNDTVLVLVDPQGPTCHKGTPTCFVGQTSSAAEDIAFLAELQAIIEQRIADRPEGSYTARLYGEGTARMAQKVGEEGVEVALAAVTADDSKFLGEIADLSYHLLLLMKSRNLSLARVVAELKARHTSRR